MNADRRTGSTDVRPWIRLWARSLDVGLVTVPILLLWWPPAAFDWLTFMLLGMAVLLLCLLIEPLLLSRWGTTPGKWVFSIRVTNADGTRLSLTQAMRRSDMVWAKGLGAGTPLVGQFLMAAAHYELSANAKTFWDADGDLEVRHGAIQAPRVIAALALAGLALLAGGVVMGG